ncbi:MAG: hypothetical protein IJW05_10195 [Lentisphaeria bacterium]|nr:hypothetical protein [Lentisphaeria bacterium]
MVKKIVHAVFAAGVVLSCAAQEMHIHKMPEPDYRDDFEKIGVDGGLSGKGYEIGNEEGGKRKCRIYGSTIIPHAAGTIVFWIKPLDWDKDSQKGNRLFLDARAPGKNLLIINCFTNLQKKNTLVVTIAKNGRDHFMRVPQIDWERNEWHQVALSYDANGFRLYIDGKRKAEAKIAPIEVPFIRSYLGGDPGWASGIFGKSMVDDFQVFHTPLTDEAIQMLYMKYAKDFPAKNAFRMQVNPRTPQMDGMVTPGEYSLGATGFFDLKTQKFARIQSRYYLSHDKENIYFAIQSPAAHKLLAKRTSRDSDIWEDDSVEIHLTAPNGTYCQFLWNSIGTLFDAKNNDQTWSGNDIVIKNEINHGIWTSEIKIPIKNFGIASIENGSKWKFNAGRTFQQERLWASVAPCRGRYAQKVNFAEIIISGNPVFFDIASIGKLDEYKLDFDFKAGSARKDQFSLSAKTKTRFAFAWSKKITAEPGREIRETVKKNGLPADSTLFVTVDSESGTLYTNAFAYEKTESLVYRYVYTDIKDQNLQIVCRKSGEEPVNLTVQMLKKGTQEEVWRKTVPAGTENGDHPITFSIKDLPAGKFDMILTASDSNGKQIFRTQQYYFKPDGTPWWFTKRDTGFSHETPAPWTKPIAGKNEFSCWGRTYKFGGKGLISSIVAKDQELLAAPITLKINGKTGTFSAKMNENLGDSALYTVSGTVNGTKVKATLQAEFDGFIKVDLDLAPGSLIESCALEIPLKNEMVDAFDNNQTFHVKTEMPPNSPVIYNNLSEMPAFWIGNQHRGLMWGAKNLKGWYTRNLGKSMEISRTQNACVVKLNLIDTRLSSTKSRRITFYLNATPVKPLNKRFKNLHQMKSYHSGVQYWTDMYETHQEEYMRERTLKNIAGKKGNVFKEVFNYITGHAASPLSPEWNYYCKDWHSPLPILGDYLAVKGEEDISYRNREAYTYACLASESFFWFKLNNLVKMIRKYKIENLYTDISWAKICSNPEHGCGYKDEFGRSQASFNVFETREYFKRLYRVLRAQNPDGVILQHLLGTTRVPAENFADIFIFGEVYVTSVASKENYYDLFKETPVKISYGYRSGEHVVSMIKEFSLSLATQRPDRYKTWSPDQPEADRAMKHFLGYCLANNIEPYPEYWIPKKAMVRSFHAYDAEDWLGNYAESEFFPYWDKTLNAPVTITNIPKKMLLSSRKYGNKVLSIIVNDTDHPVEITLSYHGVSPAKAFNMFDREREIYSISGNTLKLKFGPREAKLLCQE